tara:strand:- start:12748 stop:14151 length:1404 start_codon:yes stop_codon:yes gene_type:complete
VKPFISENWLIDNKKGSFLYHEVAKDLPIIDYHNHLNPFHLAQNKSFENLTEIWLGADPYKHRAMRIHGIPEEIITGKAGDWEKFTNWAKVLPKTIGNPLFHWSCLEMKRVFGLDLILSQHNAKEIWDHCNDLLKEKGYRAFNLLQSWKTETVCTSDELLDELEAHAKLAATPNSCRVLPSLRGDTMLNFKAPGFKNWLEKLGLACGFTITDFECYLSAIRLRLDFFEKNGCMIADHALDAGFSYSSIPRIAVEALFQKCLKGEGLTHSESVSLESYLLVKLGTEYGKRGWIMQLHIGAQRRTSTRISRLAGPAGGYAAIGKSCDINALCQLLDDIEQSGSLPDTILYTLNPADNATLASLTGSFAEDGVKGKIQFGPAWWYNDHEDGIIKQLKDLSAIGLLSSFIGMTTDSRSILSLSRHEYFRRVVCNLLGRWVEQGKLPDDIELISQLVRDISYENIKMKLQKQ